MKRAPNRERGRAAATHPPSRRVAAHLPEGPAVRCRLAAAAARPAALVAAASALVAEPRLGGRGLSKNRRSLARRFRAIRIAESHVMSFEVLQDREGFARCRSQRLRGIAEVLHAGVARSGSQESQIATFARSKPEAQERPKEVPAGP